MTVQPKVHSRKELVLYLRSDLSPITRLSCTKGLDLSKSLKMANFIYQREKTPKFQMSMAPITSTRTPVPTRKTSIIIITATRRGAFIRLVLATILTGFLRIALTATASIHTLLPMESRRSLLTATVHQGTPAFQGSLVTLLLNTAEGTHVEPTARWPTEVGMDFHYTEATDTVFFRMPVGTVTPDSGATDTTLHHSLPVMDILYTDATDTVLQDTGAVTCTLRMDAEFVVTGLVAQGTGPMEALRHGMGVDTN